MDRRHKIFFGTAVLLLLFITIRMILLAGSGGKIYRHEIEKMASQSGKLPAIRGRIYDEKGDLLVWSERCYDLEFAPAKSDCKHIDELKKDLADSFGELPLFNPDSRHTAVVKRNLTATELEKADQLCMRHPALKVELRWERRINARHDLVGEVRQIDGMEVGISGLEKKYDHILSGQPGSFTVMLDRHGNWVDSTFQITANPVSGQDVFLAEVAEEDRHE